MAEENNEIVKLLEKFKENINVEEKYTLEELKKVLTDTYKSLNKKDKQKRTASEYNLFVKEKMSEIKKEDPTKGNKQIMSEAALLWKEYKETKK